MRLSLIRFAAAFVCAALLVKAEAFKELDDGGTIDKLYER